MNSSNPLKQHCEAATMLVFSFLPQAALFFSVLSSTASAASSWTFADGSLSVTTKATSKDGGIKEKLTPSQHLSKPIAFGSSDTLKITLTAQEGKTAKRPHQAFLLVQDQHAKLDISYPFNVKESGKAVVSLTQKDLPVQFLAENSSLTSSIVLASFGSNAGYNSRAFTLTPSSDSSTPPPAAEQPLRYGKLPEIHHVFRANAKSPPVVISIVFLGAVVATLPVLAGVALYLSANVSALPAALRTSPVSHISFLASISGIEFVFFLYYTTWNLFQTLPVLGVLGVFAFLSGSRALSEVQERRLGGAR